MAEVVSPDTAKKRVRARKPQTEKHIIVPATAEQISKGVGVTKKDAALVRKVLLRLGYIKEESNSPRKAKTKPRKG